MVIPQNTVSRTVRPRLGVFMATVAVILGGAPFIVKAYLRNTVPSVWTTEHIREQRVGITQEFLETQRNVAFKRAVELATQLDSSVSRKRSSQHSSYRDAVMNLNSYDLKLAELLRADISENEEELGQVIQHEHARQLMLGRAQLLNRLVMALFTVAMLVFMYFVGGSQTVPQWAQNVSWMAAGAVLAGWFPL